MPTTQLKRIIVLVAGFILAIACAISATYMVKPGHRGVLVTLGKISPTFKPEGFGLKLPFISSVSERLVRQQTELMKVHCYSSDLQQVEMDLKILYRQPEAAVVELYRDYEDDPFSSLVRPRVAEAIKEVTAMRRAEEIVQQREQVKNLALPAVREKVGSLMVVEDLVLEDIRLTAVLEDAIEAKMVQQQEAARARFAQQQAEIDAETMVIQAKGEAEAIELRGQALRDNPSVLELQVVERWDGIAPMVVGPGLEGADLILPLGFSGVTKETGGAE